jgi:hypothetical protein
MVSSRECCTAPSKAASVQACIRVPVAGLPASGPCQRCLPSPYLHQAIRVWQRDVAHPRRGGVAAVAGAPRMLLPHSALRFAYIRLVWMLRASPREHRVSQGTGCTLSMFQYARSSIQQKCGTCPSPARRFAVSWLALLVLLILAFLVILMICAGVLVVLHGLIGWRLVRQLQVIHSTAPQRPAPDAPALPCLC